MPNPARPLVGIPHQRRSQTPMPAMLEAIHLRRRRPQRPQHGLAASRRHRRRGHTPAKRLRNLKKPPPSPQPVTGRGRSRPTPRPRCDPSPPRRHCPPGPAPQPSTAAGDTSPTTADPAPRPVTTPVEARGRPRTTGSFCSKARMLTIPYPRGLPSSGAKPVPDGARKSRHVRRPAPRRPGRSGAMPHPRHQRRGAVDGDLPRRCARRAAAHLTPRARPDQFLRHQLVRRRNRASSRRTPPAAPTSRLHLLAAGRRDQIRSAAKATPRRHIWVKTVVAACLRCVLTFVVFQDTPQKMRGSTARVV